MNWLRVTPTMLQSDDGVFQISRTPKVPLTYRLWRRATNDVLLAVSAADSDESRRAAVAKCKAMAEQLDAEMRSARV